MMKQRLTEAQKTELKDVHDETYVNFRAMQYKGVESRRIGTFHVSDYVNQCARNAYYGHLRPAIVSTFDTESLGHLWLGESVHQILDRAANTLGKMGETKLAWNIADDKPAPESIDGLGINEVAKLIFGECDGITLYKNGKYGIIDYKTYNSKGSWTRKSPDPYHVEQINIYAYLAKKALDMDISYATVIYIDIFDKGKKPLVFEELTDPLEYIELRLKQRYSQFKYAMATGELPKRTISWKCEGYCQYAKRCFTEDVITTNDLAITR